MTIEERCGIVYVDGRRYYKEDLTKRSFTVECATPFRFTCEQDNISICIEDNTWKNLIYKFVSQMDKLVSKSQEEYLAIQNDWGKQEVFSCKQLKNFEAFNGIYINLNHTAVHALWTLQLMIDFFGLDASKCQLLLRRHGSAEPKEAREYYRQRTYDGLSEYLQSVHGFSLEKTNKIIKNLTVANKLMPEISKSYDDIFLFEDAQMLTNYSKKLIHVLRYKNKLSNEQLQIIQRCVDLLIKYYYYADKKAKANA